MAEVSVLILASIAVAFAWSRTLRAEKRLEVLSKNVSDVIALHSPEGTQLWVSESSTRVLGYSPEEAVGTNLYDFVHPEDVRRLRRGLPTLVESGNVRTTVRTRKKNGAYAWMETSLNPVIVDGKVKSFVTVSRDVSTRKETEDLYRYLLRNLPDTSVFLFDSNLRHILVEGAELSSLTTRGPWSSAKTLWEVFEPDIAKTISAHYYSALRGDPVSALETFRSRTYECSVAPLYDSSGKVRVGLAVFKDVTEKRVRLRELEDRTADLERSNRDLEQFANVASHELKSPLRRIASFAALLAEEMSRPSDFEEYIDHIVGGIECLNGVIDSLLTYSRVQADRSNFAPVSSGEALNGALKNLSALRRERGALVRRGELPDGVFADPVLLRQLLENLVGNAIKFNTTGRTPEVSVTCKRGLTDWEFAVRDNGPGLDPSLSDKVFVMFSRLRPEVEGTGIGLALCKKIVSIHRGRIWFESNEDGVGVTFRFTLPA